MAIIGYIRDSKNIKGIDKYLEKMHSLGCQKIYEDDTSELKERLQWRYILENKTKGDTIIVYKMSNALGSWIELPMFLTLCKKNRIRLVSLVDGIDTDGILFDTTVCDFLPSLASFGNETYEKRPHYTKNNTEELTGSAQREQRRRTRLLLEQSVVNDYQADIGIKVISRNRGVPENTLYRILRRHGIEPNRSTGKAHSKLTLQQKEDNNHADTSQD